MKHKIFNLPRFIALILLLTCALSLCSCVTLESRETLKAPDFDSLVEYRISDSEQIKLYYQNYDEPVQQVFGEWIKGDEVTRIVFELSIKLGGLGFSVSGITDLTVRIYEVEELYGVVHYYYAKTGRELASLDEGLLNSQKIILSESQEILEIQSITVTEGQGACFSWASPQWKDFCLAKEGEDFVIEQIALRCSSLSGKGEWITNGVTVPVRVVLDENTYHIEIYDLSLEEEKRILSGNGYLEEGRFVINDFESTMFYGNTVTELVMTRWAE